MIGFIKDHSVVRFIRAVVILGSVSVVRTEYTASVIVSLKQDRSQTTSCQLDHIKETNQHNI